MIPRPPHSKGLNVFLGRHMPGHMQPGSFFCYVFLILSVAAELASKSPLATNHDSGQDGEYEQGTWVGLETDNVSLDRCGLDSTVFAD